MEKCIVLEEIMYEIIYFLNYSKNGQLGLGNSNEMHLPTKISYSGAPILKIATRVSSSYILDSTGVLYSFGSNSVSLSIY